MQNSQLLYEAPAKTKDFFARGAVALEALIGYNMDERMCAAGTIL